MTRAWMLAGLLVACNTGKANLSGDCSEGGVRYVDNDGDGVGSMVVDACDASPDDAIVGGDCDDDDPTIHPGADDVCGDGIDADCEGDPDRCDVSLADAAAKLMGADSGDRAGDSTASAGDLDGDGHRDVVVGAPGAETVYVAYGPMVGVIDLTEANATVATSSGPSVAGVGDADGDGLDDVLVGDPEAEPGYAYLVLGPLAGDYDATTVDVLLQGEATYSRAGASVAAAGDVDGDGTADLLIGSPYLGDGGDGAGAAYLVLGPLTGGLSLTSADARYIGEDDGDHAGRWVASAGDTNGDGTREALVGAPDRGDGGAVYLVAGSNGGTFDLSGAEAKVLAEASGDHVGTAIASAGDVDGDGLDDVIIGAYGNDAAASEAGAAYLVLGPISGTINLSAADTKLLGERSGDHAGNSVCGAGDLDGDHNGDVAIGAAGDHQVGLDAGAAYLVLAPGSGTIDLGDVPVKLLAEQSASYAGDSVASAGDMDGDGLDDVIVGASADPQGGNYAGAAYILLGGQW